MLINIINLTISNVLDLLYLILFIVFVFVVVVVFAFLINANSITNNKYWHKLGVAHYQPYSMHETSE